MHEGDVLSASCIAQDVNIHACRHGPHLEILGGVQQRGRVRSLQFRHKEKEKKRKSDTQPREKK